MSFDLIPADLLIKIFHQLPFKDRVRLGGVNRLFRNASEESIAKMKYLVIDDDLDSYLIWNPKFSLSTLLESCSPILKSIEVNTRSCSGPFLSALAEFVYPKLESLKITVQDFSKDQMKRLISRSQSLRSIELQKNWQIERWDDIVMDDQAIQALAQLEHLREFRVDTRMKKAEIIDLITNVRSLAILHISKISDDRPEAFIDFLTSTAVVQRDLDVVCGMAIDVRKRKYFEIEDILDEIRYNDGPAVFYKRDGIGHLDMNWLWITLIRYRSLDG